jgi:hypothetical protein
MGAGDGARTRDILSPDHTGGAEAHYHPEQRTGHRVAPSRDGEWLHHLTVGGLTA